MEVTGIDLGTFNLEEAMRPLEHSFGHRRTVHHENLHIIFFAHKFSHLKVTVSYSPLATLGIQELVLLSVKTWMITLQINYRSNVMSQLSL